MSDLLSRGQWTLLAGAAAAGVALGAASCACQSGSPELPPFDCQVRLTDDEQESYDMLKFSNVRTVTLLSPAPGDAGGGESVESYLRQRVSEIILQNRWLMGEVRRLGGDNALHLTWRSDVAAEDAAAQLITIPGRDATLGAMLSATLAAAEAEGRGAAATPSVGLTEFCKHVNGMYADRFKAPSGEDCLFKAVLIDVSEADGGDRFALITSLNHSVGDGSTYYTLQKMLSCDAEVAPLVVERSLMHETELFSRYATKGRVKDFSGIIARVVACGCTQDTCDSVRGALSRVPGLGWLAPPGRMLGVFVPSQAKIEEAKREASQGGGVEFVSTNDVLTSWWWQKSVAFCAEKLMMVNLRGRAPGLTSRHAGNYFCSLAVNPLQGEAPQDIRRILNEGNSQTQRPASALAQLRSTYTEVTNWRTFHHPIATPTHKEALHFPLHEYYGVVHIAIIFQLTPEVVGMAMDKAPFFDVDAMDDGMMQYQVMGP